MRQNEFNDLIERAIEVEAKNSRNFIYDLLAYIGGEVQGKYFPHLKFREVFLKGGIDRSSKYFFFRGDPFPSTQIPDHLITVYRPEGIQEAQLGIDLLATGYSLQSTGNFTYFSAQETPFDSISADKSLHKEGAFEFLVALTSFLNKKV